MELILLHAQIFSRPQSLYLVASLLNIFIFRRCVKYGALQVLFE